jgi:hypothetical protein
LSLGVRGATGNYGIEGVGSAVVTSNLWVAYPMGPCRR